MIGGKPKADEEDVPAGTYVLEGDGFAMSRPQSRASIIAALLFLIAGLLTLKGFLPALAWAVIFAIGLWPLIERLGRRYPRHRGDLLPLLAVVAVLLVFVIPVAMIAVPLVSDAHDASQWAAQARANGIPVPAFVGSLPFGDKLMSLWQHNLGQPGQISALASHAAQGGLMDTARAVGAQAVHRIVLLGFMLLTLFFLLKDGRSVADQLRVASRRTFGPAGEDVGAQIIRSIHGTINGLVVVGLVEGVILGIAYAVAGVPHPTLFGVFTALLAMVPFGAALAFLAAALALLATGHVIGGIVIIVLGFAVTFVADHFVRPVLIGGATKLPFLWVLLGILGGVEAWGLVGLFMGPAIMAVLVLLWREFVGTQRGPLNPRAAVAVAAKAACSSTRRV